MSIVVDAVRVARKPLSPLEPTVNTGVAPDESSNETCEDAPARIGTRYFGEMTVPDGMTTESALATNPLTRFLNGVALEVV